MLLWVTEGGNTSHTGQSIHLAPAQANDSYGLTSRAHPHAAHAHEPPLPLNALARRGPKGAAGFCIYACRKDSYMLSCCILGEEYDKVQEVRHKQARWRHAQEHKAGMNRADAATGRSAPVANRAGYGAAPP